MVRDETKGAERTVLNTFGVAAAHVALDWDIAVIVGIYCTKGAGFNAGKTGDTEVLIQADDIIDAGECPDGAYSGTSGFLTLAADYRHAHDRVRIRIHDPDGRFLGVIYAEVFDSTNKFADTAIGALLGDNSQFPGHYEILQRKNPHRDYNMAEGGAKNKKPMKIFQREPVIVVIRQTQEN
jgi:hypothetical protein